MNPTSPTRPDSKSWPWAVAGVAIGVCCFCLAMANRTVVWLDEAHTYWVIRDGFSSLFEKLAQDVHPPLFFCLTSAATGLLGISPWALRIVSVLAAAATVPATYWAARSYSRPPWAFGVALLVGTHPLFLYYGFNARNYALFLLLLAAAVGALFRAVRPTARPRDWILAVVLLVLLLNTHNLAVFTFLPLLGLGMIVAGPRWLAVGWRLLAAEAIAFATYLPWFLTAARAEGGIAWIADFWRSADKWALPWQSVLSFGVGAQYPKYLGPPHAIHGLPILGGVVTAALIATALVGASPAAIADNTRPRSLRAVAFALAAGLGSLLLLWLYSWMSQPIYLVGRYDLIAFPFVALLLGLGLQVIGERFRWPGASATALILCVGINVCETLQLWTRADEDAPPPLGIVTNFMAAKGHKSGDVVITRGQIPYLIIGYAADDAGLAYRFVPFPSEFGRHPGWYEASIFLRDPARLQKDAEAIAQEAARALDQGHRVWLVGDGDPAVDAFLLSELKRVAYPDPASSNPELRVFALHRR